MAAPSRAIEDLFRRSMEKWAKEYGYTLWLHKFHADEYSGSGIPDFIGEWRGVSFACEIKSERDRPSQEQIEWVRLHPGVAFFCIKNVGDDYFILNREQFCSYSMRNKGLWQKLDLYHGIDKSGRFSILRIELIETLIALHRSESWRKKST